jgi:transposase
VHLSCDGAGRPLSIVLSAGQRHESTQLAPVLDAIRVPRRGVGRPRSRPERVIGDKAFSTSGCRQLLRRRGIRSTIPSRRDQRQHRFDRATYRRRNVVERCVNRLKQWRAIATRYEKRAVNYHAMVTIGALLIWLPT